VRRGACPATTQERDQNRAGTGGPTGLVFAAEIERPLVSRNVFRTAQSAVRDAKLTVIEGAHYDGSA